MKYYIGVDLGGTNSKIGVLDEEGNILESNIIKTLSIEGVDSTFSRIWEEAKNILERLNIDVSKVRGMGMGVPGPIENQAIARYFSNLSWERDLNLKAKLENLTGIESKIENDLNIIALGEDKFGAGRGAKTSVTVAVGTGIGAGICIAGKILSGANGAAGELGHIKLVKDGKLCGCGQYGCFEAYASATGLIREAMSRLVVNKNNKLYEIIDRNISKLEAKDVFDAAEMGDEFSKQLVDYEAEYLAMGIASILNTINPEVLILGGGMFFAKDLILNPVKEKLKKYTLPTALSTLEIKLSELGNEAGIKGAIALFD